MTTEAEPRTRLGLMLTLITGLIPGMGLKVGPVTLVIISGLSVIWVRLTLIPTEYLTKEAETTPKQSGADQTRSRRTR